MSEELSEAALSLCAKHYNKGNGCGRCPIQEPCHRPTRPLTWDSLNDYRSNINAAAAKAQALEVMAADAQQLGLGYE